MNRTFVGEGDGLADAATDPDTAGGPDSEQHDDSKGSEIAALIKAKCPNGVAKLDVGKLKLFEAKVKAVPEGNEQSFVAGRVALVLDYDLTVSAGGATEGHHLIRDSPEIPQQLRDDLKNFWSYFEGDPGRKSMHPVLRDIVGDAAMIPHAFWIGFNRIIISHGLTSDMITKAVAAEKKRQGSILRPGIEALFDICQSQQIPIVILSAGISHIIKEAFKQDGIQLPRVCQILANEFIFNEEDRCVDVEPKNPPSSRQGKLHQLAFAPDIAERPCVILVGDKPVDASVGRGLPQLSCGKDHVLIKFGFLNEASPTNQSLAEFRNSYDILPESGGSCTWAPVTALLEAVLPKVRQ